MIVGWLFPDRERCGIAIYSRNYCAALKDHCKILAVNSDRLHKECRQLYEQLNMCDCIHIQYETSFFLRGGTDHYLKIIKHLKKPAIVSLHEVYEQFPGVFPREKIGEGNKILSPLIKWWYDYRHPYQTAYHHHLQAGFGVSRLLVHHEFHKKILERKVPASCQLIVQPMPIFKDTQAHQPEITGTLSLGTTGFINPEYDYELLFKALSGLKGNWTFTWIGGIRIIEHQNLLDTITREISSRNWADRFRITGWVSQEEQSRYLSKIDIYLALFKNRSSSASIARALGARKLIIATENTIISEINNSLGTNVIRITQHNPDALIHEIKSMSNDKIVKSRYYESIDHYVANYNFNTMARSMLEIYRTL